MSAKLVTFGILCLLSIAVAGCARHDRACAVKVASIIAANWLACSMPWIDRDLSYSAIMHAWGLPAKQTDGFALFDMLALMGATRVCWRAWWAPVIWSIYLIGLTMHALAWSAGLQYVDYAAVLDAGLAVQLAVIFMVGGPGCADRVSDCWVRVRAVVGASGWVPEARS